MSGRCGGLHCPGCGDGGGGPVVLVIVVVIAAACAGPVVGAVIDLVEIAAITAAGLLAVGAVVAALVWRARRRRRAAAELAALPRRSGTGPAPVHARLLPWPGRIRAVDRWTGESARGSWAPAALEAPRIGAGAHVVTGDAALAPRCPYASCHHNAPDEVLPAWRRREEVRGDG